MAFYMVDALRNVRHVLRRYKVIVHPGSVTIAALDVDRILFIRQERPAIATGLLELPAGTLEPGEDPASAAKRELEEETGYSAQRVVPLGRFFLAPGYSTEETHLFVATELTQTSQALDEGEEITEVLWIDRHDAMAMVRTGELHDAKSIAALTLLNAAFLWR